MAEERAVIEPAAPEFVKDCLSPAIGINEINSMNLASIAISLKRIADTLNAEGAAFYRLQDVGRALGVGIKEGMNS